MLLQWSGFPSHRDHSQVTPFEVVISEVLSTPGGASIYPVPIAARGAFAFVSTTPLTLSGVAAAHQPHSCE